jgi:hypothetical protein
MNIPLCAGRVIPSVIKVALSTKLCASSNKSKGNIAIDMNNNIKDVFILIKQSISERISVLIKSKNSAFFGSSTMIIKKSHYGWNTSQLTKRKSWILMS